MGILPEWRLRVVVSGYADCASFQATNALRSGSKQTVWGGTTFVDPTFCYYLVDVFTMRIRDGRSYT